MTRYLDEAEARRWLAESFRPDADLEHALAVRRADPARFAEMAARRPALLDHLMIYGDLKALHGVEDTVDGAA